MKDSNFDADVDALEGLGFCFAAARRSQLAYSSTRALSQLPANKDGAAENPRDAGRCGAISAMCTSCAASPTLKTAAREQFLEERGANPATQPPPSIAQSACPLQRFGGGPRVWVGIRFIKATASLGGPLPLPGALRKLEYTRRSN